MNNQPVAPKWRKSSFCDHGNCVEVAGDGAAVRVRNTTRPERQLAFDRGSWQDLLRDIRGSRLDR